MMEHERLIIGEVGTREGRGGTEGRQVWWVQSDLGGREVDVVIIGAKIGAAALLLTQVHALGLWEFELLYPAANKHATKRPETRLNTLDRNKRNQN